MTDVKFAKFLLASSRMRSCADPAERSAYPMTEAGKGKFSITSVPLRSSDHRHTTSPPSTAAGVT
jgi:hypothetical protein